MGYDWENIFENKTNKELYDIVSGKIVLTKEAKDYAKQELIKRKFDFNNMEGNKAAWEISEIIEEEEIANSEIFLRKASFISLRTYFIIISGIVLSYYLINKFAINPMPFNAFMFFIALATFFVWLNNFIYKKQQQAHIDRIEKFNNLKRKLEEKDLLKENTPIYGELIRHKKKRFKEFKVLQIITVIILAVFLLIIIAKAIMKI